MLEKIVIDWKTLFSRPILVRNMKNCILYISDSNIEKYKQRINKFINSPNTSKEYINAELIYHKDFINFIKHNSEIINQPVMQTDEILFDKNNNSYIVIVKSTKDVSLMLPNSLPLNQCDNDTLFIALAEEAQLFTTSSSLLDAISNNNLAVFIINALDINDRS